MDAEQALDMFFKLDDDGCYEVSIGSEGLSDFNFNAGEAMVTKSTMVAKIQGMTEREKTGKTRTTARTTSLCLGEASHAVEVRFKDDGEDKDWDEVAGRARGNGHGVDEEVDEEATCKRLRNGLGRWRSARNICCRRCRSW